MNNNCVYFPYLVSGLCSSPFHLFLYSFLYISNKIFKQSITIVKKVIESRRRWSFSLRNCDIPLKKRKRKKIILITPSLDTLKDRSKNRRWFAESVLWIRRNRDLIWFRDHAVVRIKSGGRVINERRGRKSICEIPAAEGGERRTWDQDRMKSIRVATYTRTRYHESIYRATPGSRGLCAVLLIDRRN